MSFSRSIVPLAGVICFFCLSPSAQPQLTRGFVSGIIHDPSGAVVPHAQLTLTEAATQTVHRTESTDLGVYRFVSVEPGDYRLEILKPGYVTAVVEHVPVSAAQEAVINRQLAVAEAVTKVEITSEVATAQLAKASPMLERKFESEFVRGIALTPEKRDVTRLALLAPTVSRGPGAAGFSANGQRSRNNNFIVDGVDNNDITTSEMAAPLPPEAVAELHVMTTPYSTEFGRSSGAQVSIVTRNGTNQFHGDARNYYRANWLEPLSLLNKRAGITETPRFVQNQAGGTLGGPIVRNKTFFFALLDTNRRREAPDARNADPITIPTPAGVAALSRIPLAPGQSTASRQSALNALNFLPDAQKLIPAYDNITSVNVNGVPVEVGSALIPVARPHNYWNVLGRIDHQLGSKDNLTYRYHLDRENTANSDSNLGFGDRFSANEQAFNQNHNLSETRAMTPYLVNEARFAYVRQNFAYLEHDTTSSTDVGGMFTIGGSSLFPQARIGNTFQFQDVVTWLHGRHSIKVGADVRRNRLFNRTGFDAKGTWAFDSFEDFINNRASSFRQAVNEASFDARQTSQNYFAQDDIRLTRNLNVNFGIRYEFSGVPFGFFGATDPQVRAAGVPGPVQPDRNNWAPRGGFAWSPTPTSSFAKKLLGDGSTVFRGGYGIAYDVLFYNLLIVNASNYPRVVTAEIDAPDTWNVFPAKLPVQASAPPFSPSAVFRNSPADLQNPTTHFYSFSIQRQLRPSLLVEVGYSGNRSYHQIRQGQANPGVLTPQQAATVMACGSPGCIPSVQDRRVNPAWGSRVLLESTANANYNAVFIRADYKLGRNLLFGANYTWSANFNDNDEALNIPDFVNSAAHVPQNYFNYGNEYARSIFDRPQRAVFHYAYEIPYRFRLARPLFSGWRISGFSEFESGQPFTVRTGVDSGGTGIATPFRPNYNPAGLFVPDPVTGNLRTFTTPIDGTGVFVTPLTPSRAPLANSMPGGGNLGRNSLRGPGFENWNMSVAKTIALFERMKVSLRGDLMNAFNHRNFGNPVVLMNSPAFGTNVTDPGARSVLVSAQVRF